MAYISPKSQRESGRIGKVLRGRIGRLKVVCLQKASEWRKCLRLPKIKGRGIPQSRCGDMEGTFLVMGVLRAAWAAAGEWDWNESNLVADPEFLNSDQHTDPLQGFWICTKDGSNLAPYSTKVQSFYFRSTVLSEISFDEKSVYNITQPATKPPTQLAQLNAPQLQLRRGIIDIIKVPCLPNMYYMWHIKPHVVTAREVSNRER